MRLAGSLRGNIICPDVFPEDVVDATMVNVYVSSSVFGIA